MSANSAKRWRLKACGATSVSSRDAGGHNATQPTSTIPCDNAESMTSSPNWSMTTETAIDTNHTKTPSQVATFSWRVCGSMRRIGPLARAARRGEPP